MARSGHDGSVRLRTAHLNRLRLPALVQGGDHAGFLAAFASVAVDFAPGVSNHAGTPTAVDRMTKRNAKRILSEAAPHIGNEVIVIAPGVEGAGYFGTSISVGSSQGIERNIALVNEALKKLKQWHRRLLQEESIMAKGSKGCATEVPIGAAMKKVKGKKVPAKKSMGGSRNAPNGALKGGKK